MKNESLRVNFFQSSLAKKYKLVRAQKSLILSAFSFTPFFLNLRKNSGCQPSNTGIETAYQASVRRGCEQ
jgi:hypothetical protein